MTPIKSTARVSRYGGAIAILLAVAAFGSACANTPTATTSTPAPITTQAPITTAPPAASETVTTPPSDLPGVVVVKTADSSLGKILVNAEGRTLYGFTTDKPAGTSTCFGQCAVAWPPLLVGANDKAAPEINAGIVSTIIRTDGQRQFVVGPYPLYTYVGDTAPGDLSGSGLGGVWFPMAPDGTLITEGVTVNSSAVPGGSETASVEPSGSVEPSASAPDTSQATPPTTDTGYGTPPTTQAPVEKVFGKATTSLGEVFTNAAGLTLYGFTDDTEDKSNCNGGCAQAWPPLTVPSADLPAGLDPAKWSVGTRDDGTFQLKNGKWWLYTYTGDAAAGETNGQGAQGKWFVVGTDGKLIK